MNEEIALFVMITLAVGIVALVQSGVASRLVVWHTKTNALRSVRLPAGCVPDERMPILELPVENWARDTYCAMELPRGDTWSAQAANDRGMTVVHAAVTRGDFDAATALFGDDSYWRDLVSFTWNIKTAEGAGEIRKMLEATMPIAKPSNFAIQGEGSEAGGVTESWFTFETGTGRETWHVDGAGYNGAVAFSPDGRYIFSGGDQGIIWQWDGKWQFWRKAACEQLKEQSKNSFPPKTPFSLVCPPQPSSGPGIPCGA